MIISDRYRYVFVELPFTASTALSRELQKHYGGRRVLRKHSSYREFLKYASPEQRKYFSFSGVRNPLDEAVSLYIKLCSNHRGNYTARRRWVTRRMKRRYLWVQSNPRSFREFFLRFYRLPVENWSSLDHHRLDYVYRLETIQRDFTEILRRIGLEQVRPLPVVHKTEGKERWERYYTPETRARAVSVFGPIMERWGYEFPPDWEVGEVPRTSKLLYSLLVKVKNTARRLRPIRHPPDRRP